MSKQMHLSKLVRWMTNHPRLSALIAISGLGVPLLYVYAWIAELREKYHA